jgi:hypothetical protein
MSLYDVTIRRTYTEEYLAKWPGKKAWDTVALSWAFDRESVEEYWTKQHGANRSEYFDNMYRDSVVSIERVTDEELIVRRNRLQSLSYTNPCCTLAVLRNCVCRYSTSCPVHGGRCHGTHD